MLNCKQLKEDVDVIGKASKEAFDQSETTDSGPYKQKFDTYDIVLINGEAYVVLGFDSKYKTYWVENCMYDNKFYVNEKYLTHYLFR